MAINPFLLSKARSHFAKQAFVAAGDPSMGGAPMDPAMAGGAGGAPMDPAMAGGGAPPMDPAAAGGAPPMDPAMAGGGDPLAALQPIIQQEVQKAMAGAGGGAAAGGAGAAPGIKPKIDINIEVMQIKKMLAKIIDTLGIHVPVQDMVATPEDLQQMAEGGPGAAATTPDSQGGGGGLGQISPIEPMKAAEWENGEAYKIPDYLEEGVKANRSISDLATALLATKARR